jgi:hypothetical protein
MLGDFLALDLKLAFDEFVLGPDRDQLPGSRGEGTGKESGRTGEAAVLAPETPRMSDMLVISPSPAPRTAVRDAPPWTLRWRVWLFKSPPVTQAVKARRGRGRVVGHRRFTVKGLFLQSPS